MLVQNSLDWGKVSGNLRDQMQAAPNRCRKDLAKMIGQIEVLAQELSKEEVEMRRCKKTTSPRHASLLERVNQSITDFEQWLMLAHLQHG
jgi:hypothetical protein